MEAAIGPLRARLREALARQSPAMGRLAAGVETSVGTMRGTLASVAGAMVPMSDSGEFGGVRGVLPPAEMDAGLPPKETVACAGIAGLKLTSRFHCGRSLDFPTKRRGRGV